MIENEYKYIATKNDIEKMRTVILNNDSILSTERFIQINYYYDTDDLKFQAHGTTIRIRQKESGLKLQIKKKNYYGENKNLETETKISNIFNELIVENTEVTLKGQLVTGRTRNIFSNGARMDLDINYYCGMVDYEIEIELPDEEGNMEDVFSLVSNLASAKMGKATRFYNAKNAILNKWLNMENIIRRALADVLNIENISEISQQDNLENVGLDSINFVMLIVTLEDVLDIQISENKLEYKNFQTIEKILKVIEEQIYGE